MKTLRKLLLLLTVILVYACIGLILGYPLLTTSDKEASAIGEVIMWAYAALGVWVIITAINVWHDDSV